MRPHPLCIFAIFAVFAGAAQAASVCPAPRPMSFQVEKKITRDVSGFTEGLEVHEGGLYESTGALGGGTRLMRIAPDGHVTVLKDSGEEFFGEGLTFLGGQLFQLSWEDHKVFVYDLSAKLQRVMRNPRQGWGLTNDGRYLIFGDGGTRLFFAEPATFAIKGAITVRRGKDAVDNINELEYVGGKIYANIWMTRSIVRIDARSGCIEAEAAMDSLWEQMTPDERDYIGRDPDFVLNGIAYDPGSKLFTVTGKKWPFVFTGRFLEQ